MKRVAGLLGVAGCMMLASAARAQLVPLSLCNAAIPCSLPFGLRPANAVAGLAPFTRAGEGGALVSARAGIGAGEPLRLDKPRPAIPDASEQAARIFLRKNPPPAMAPNRAPATSDPK